MAALREFLSSVDAPVVRSSEYLDVVVAALKGNDVEVVQDIIGLQVEDLRSQVVR